MSQVSVFSQSSPILTGKDLHPEPSPASPAPVTRVSFPNALSQFVFTRTYPRWREEDNRRETYEEAVERYVSFLRAERDVPESVLKSIQEGILRMDVMPSMRAFWSAGDAALRDNTMFYNCSFIPLDSLKSFSELLYILMMGTGVGFSVEHRFVNNLPVVAPDVKMPCEEIDYVIEDSTVGWMEAVYDCLVHNFNGRIVRFDYSRIRPAGARLKTKGGRASGPEPLRRLLDFIQDTVLGAQGRKLSSVECNDIACMIGEIVMAGGVRRAALISFSDPDDLGMRHAKDWSRGSFPACRYMANNSAFWTEKPNRETFDAEWTALRNSGSGERGFFMFPKAKQAERRGDCRSNPCGEILLRYSESTNPWTGEGGGGQFCNLSAAVMRSWDTRETFANKVRIATWIGAIQSTFTDFPHLRIAWKHHCDEDRLLGVDITGHCDNPSLSGDPDAMLYFNQVARETAAEAAAYLDIPMPAAITCGKPSGNSSQLVDCASGFHTRYAAYYIRRVRIAGTDPLFHLIRDAGVPVHKDNQFQDVPDDKCPTWVAEFPVKSPEGAMIRSDETAIEQLNRYLQIMRTWCSDRGHNQSATVYVRDHEWDEVGDWVFEHFDEITGLSFLPYDGGKYRLAPYEEITEEQYNALRADFPEIDWSLLPMYETEDMGEGAKELACVGGSCTIDYDALSMEVGKVEEWQTLENSIQESTADMAEQED
jgi:ribonucleoside-triphosphate reductase